LSCLLAGNPDRDSIQRREGISIMRDERSWHKQLRAQRRLHNWSIEELAEQLECDPKTVGRWEQGKAFPSPYLRRKLAALLAINFTETEPAPGEKLLTQLPTLKEDWDESPAVEHFYGREQELARVLHWIESERCRVIAITGLGGIGKTSFAIKAARLAMTGFQRVWWRSLQNPPPVEQLVASCLHFLLSEQHLELPSQLDQQITLLIEVLREQRCLLILDNAESLLQPQQSAGHYQPAYAGYGQLIRKIGEVQHQSCLLVTSREKSEEIAQLEGDASPVRVLPLSGLKAGDSRALLQDRHLQGTDEDWTVLTWLYRGNPLALKLIAGPIGEVFQGNIAGFLQEEASVFGDLHRLLEQQFARLSALELEIVYWLAIEREEIDLDTLRADITRPLAKGAFLDALASLRRRSLVEMRKEGHLMLQPVILEDATSRLIETVSLEFEEGRIGLLGTHALLKAESRDYIRQAQARFILTPIAEKLLQSAGRRATEQKIRHLLTQLRETQRPDYAAGNLLNLLLHLGCDLRGYDFSRLTIRQAYLQNRLLPEVNFSHAHFSSTVFTSTFSSLQCVAVSPDGRLLAAGTTTGAIWLWSLPHLTPLGTCPGHVDGLRALAFSNDSRLLASGGEDEIIRVWDASTRTCLHQLAGHTDFIRGLAFAPAGSRLASCSEDTTIRLWEATSGECLFTLQGHTSRVRAVAFADNGERLISGGDDATLRLWESATGRQVRVLEQTSSPVIALAFNAAGQVLASGHADGQARVWDLETGHLLHVLSGHADWIRSLAIDPSGTLLITGSDDATLRLWNPASGQLLSSFHGHTSRVWSLAFLPDARGLVSVSEDETLRVWDVHSRECRQLLRGYVTLMKALAFSPDGQILVSGSEDQRICLWDVASGQLLRTLTGHTRRIRTVAYSPDGATIASGSEDESVRIWDAHTGTCLHVLAGHTHLVRTVAFSPDGRQLASAGYDQQIQLWDVRSGRGLKTWPGEQGIIWSVAFSPAGQLFASAGDDHTIRLWDLATSQPVRVLRGHQHRVWSVAFSPDGQLLASSGDDHTVRLWSIASGDSLHVLRGHEHWVRAVAFSPDGRTVASASHDQCIRLWDTTSGDCLRVITGHTNGVWSVAFHPDGQTLASCGDDSTIRIWDTSTGQCVRLLRNDGPYERMNITGASGLSAAQVLSLKLLGAVEE
jgi:WD40 repeat protein/transcriptional regulator with XRE-family HTH domain